MNGVVRFFATWTIMIFLLVLLAKTNWGRPIVYGLVWLSILILVFSHSEELTSFFSPTALQLNG